MNAGELLRERLGDGLLVDEPMRRHTTFRIGGPADFFLVAHKPGELVAALRAAHELALPVFVLGGGSNLLVADDGVRGLVIQDACDHVAFEGHEVRADAGVGMHDLVERCHAAGLAGLEFAAGLPGTVGGALFGNAGCYGLDVGSRMVEGTLVTRDGATTETVSAAWLEFGYRDSRLKREPRVLLSCRLRLEPGDRAAIRREIEEKMALRRERHPDWRRQPTAGSYFKNLPPDWRTPGARLSPGTRRVAAGQLLDECGCRGLRVGGAVVFERHANIIVNDGGATAADVLALAALMKRRVHERFGVELEEEVRFLGRGSAGEPPA